MALSSVLQHRKKGIVVERLGEWKTVSLTVPLGGQERWGHSVKSGIKQQLNQSQNAARVGMFFTIGVGPHLVAKTRHEAVCINKAELNYASSLMCEILKHGNSPQRTTIRIYLLG